MVGGGERRTRWSWARQKGKGREGIGRIGKGGSVAEGRAALRLSRVAGRGQDDTRTYKRCRGGEREA
ncbi:hypothetical protein E2C01_041204 [Portunus trituberculatus]|uniref:Uncharacterized protein n=1 Tax=Portunus trituberculatus TaxID=210409 RepID=A0A5B7FRA4_PORTR|nr:hypothetical protein [Portunus trituberculatus]